MRNIRAKESRHLFKEKLARGLIREKELIFSFRRDQLRSGNSRRQLLAEWVLQVLPRGFVRIRRYGQAASRSMRDRLA